MQRLTFTLLLLPSLLTSNPTRAADDLLEIKPDVVYGHKNGLAMTMDVFKPTKQNSAGVLFMVSGGWYSRHIDPDRVKSRFAPLTQAGFTVFAVRHGSSPKYVIPEILVDVRRAVRFVRLNARSFGIDPQRLGVYGGSAGGHLSLILGTTADKGNAASRDPVLRESSHVAAVVAYYPPTDIRPWVTDKTSQYYQNYPALQFDPKLADACSPLLQVSSADSPTLLIHGDQDKLVPIAHSENILREFQKHKVVAKLLTIKDAAHGFRGEDLKTVDQATIDWFKEHLAEKAIAP